MRRATIEHKRRNRRRTRASARFGRAGGAGRELRAVLDVGFQEAVLFGGGGVGGCGTVVGGGGVVVVVAPFGLEKGMGVR